MPFYGSYKSSCQPFKSCFLHFVLLFYYFLRASEFIFFYFFFFCSIHQNFTCSMLNCNMEIVSIALDLRVLDHWTCTDWFNAHLKWIKQVKDMLDLLHLLCTVNRKTSCVARIQAVMGVKLHLYCSAWVHWGAASNAGFTMNAGFMNMSWAGLSLSPRSFLWRKDISQVLNLFPLCCNSNLICSAQGTREV